MPHARTHARTALVGGALLAALALAAAPARAVEPVDLSGLIGNTGFESGFTGWARIAPTGLSAIARSGESSAKLSATTGEVKRTIGGLKRSQRYLLSTWVRGAAKLGARNFGGPAVSASKSASDWSRATVAFITSASSTSAEIFARWTSGGDARVDDFRLLESPCTFPAEIIDVSTWKLQLPLGSPTIEIENPELAAYAREPYFRVSDDCGSVRFRAHTSGTTTSGSEYPRSELREMEDDGVTKASWSTTSGTHEMFIDQAITAVPDGKPHVIAGQIHGGDNDVIVIRLEGNRLMIKPNGRSSVTLDPSYTLGKRFRVKFVAQGGYVKVYYDGSTTPAYTLQKSKSTCYFKAGAYTQSNCSTESAAGESCGQSNYGEVKIYDLWVRHG